MAWSVEFHDDFQQEFSRFETAVQDELLAKALLLGKFGPSLGRPHADTLRGSKYAGMKELRFVADHGIWRVAFAFDPARNAILLMGGDKKGRDEKRFYQKLIRLADSRFEQHLKNDKKEKKDGNTDTKGPGRPSKGAAGKSKGDSE